MRFDGSDRHADTEEAVAIRQVRPLDALKTYRYLRIGMIGAVLLLATSIVIESFDAENAVTGAKWCLQNSISAYYYTPVRAIFVGCMFLVGLSLIAYKGHDVGEDFLLNVAGMLAPVVAVVPTTAVGHCYSINPKPQPLTKDPLTGEVSLANWVLKIVDNNIDALFFVGFIAVILGFIIWQLNLRNPRRRDEIHPHTRELLVGTFVVLVAALSLKLFRRDFFLANAHGWSANLLFVFLWFAILANVRLHWKEEGRPWVKQYLVVAALMVVGIPVSLLFGAHKIFVLEAWEIMAFATYWILQTVENWDEEVIVCDEADPGVQLTSSATDGASVPAVLPGSQPLERR